MTDCVEESVSDPLFSFCTDFFSSNPQNWPPSEDALAKAFISRFPVPWILFQEGVEALCEKLCIEVSFRQLPSDLAGVNGAYQEKREIILSVIENPLGITTHTLFHEIREIIERVFIGLEHPTIPPAEMEKQAEEFAIAVRWNSAIKESEILFEKALNISSDWLRWGSIAALIIFVLAQGIGCAYVPQMERMSQKS